MNIYRFLNIAGCIQYIQKSGFRVFANIQQELLKHDCKKKMRRLTAYFLSILTVAFLLGCSKNIDSNRVQKIGVEIVEYALAKKPKAGAHKILSVEFIGENTIAKIQSFRSELETGYSVKVKEVNEEDITHHIIVSPMNSNKELVALRLDYLHDRDIFAIRGYWTIIPIIQKR